MAQKERGSIIMVDNNTAQESQETETEDSGLELNKFVVRTRDGNVDVQATHTKFSHELHRFIQEEKIDNETIAAAVRRAFADRSVKTLPMGAVLQYTMEGLNVEPHNYTMIRDRVSRYIRNNVARFKVAKGKGGGVSWLDESAQSQPSVPTAATPSNPPSGSIRARSNA